MRINELPIVPHLKELLEAEGLDHLYPPQADAINAGVLDGKNLVLASPTASGKTLVAELCMLKHVLENNGKALYLAPLRALASEKYKEFRRYEGLKKHDGTEVRVGISTGDYDSSDPWLARYDIIISTNEKADSLLRHKAPWMSELTLVVADEVHLLTEHERGPTLEIVLTRLREINSRIQVLALSATVRNAEELADWLKADSVTTEWRPVPLREGIYVDGQVQFNDGTSRKVESETSSPVLDVALSVLGDGGQALVFTETRRSAVEMGRKASAVLKPKLSRPEQRALETVSKRILSVGEKTRLSEALAQEVASGAGFHHAGLAPPHRALVEDSFRDGRIKILAATPTLCLPEGEEIFGNPAPVAIQDLSSNSRVLTHGNTFEKVVSPTRRWYNGPLVKVTPWSQLPMRMTPEHRVFRVTRSKHSLHTRRTNRHRWTYTRPEWVKAKNLRVGDLVLFPRIKEEHDFQHISLPSPVCFKQEFGLKREQWSRLGVDRLDLTSQTLEVLGLYIGGGYTGTDGQVAFALNSSTTDLTLIVRAWFENLGLRPVQDAENHMRIVRAYSKQLAQLFHSLFGGKASEKKIAPQLMYLPNRRLSHVVRGMWLGNGDVTKSGPRTARYSTVSRVLAKQLFAVLVKLGYMPSIKLSRCAGITHAHDLYTVSVSGRQLNRFFSEILQAPMRKFEGKGGFNRGHIDSEYYYMPIRRLESEHYQGTVHNLEVEGHSSYVGSFVVHNSAGVNLPARAVIISSYERFEAGLGRYPISVLEYKQFCLPHATGVTLYDGSVVPIGNLVNTRSQARVVSVSNPHGIAEKPIADHFERFANELVEISTSIGRGIATTPEHPLLTRGSAGQGQWTPAGKLRPGDMIAFARGIVPSDDPVEWLDFLSPSTTYVMQPIPLLDKRYIHLGYEYLSRRLGLKLKTFKDYIGKRRNPSLRVVLSLAELLGIDRKTVSSDIRAVRSKRGKTVHLPPHVNEDFMWLVGIIASAGHLKRSKTRGRSTCYHIRVFNKNERIIERTVSILEGMGLNPRLSERSKGVRAVKVGSNTLGPLIAQFGIPFRDKPLRVFVPDFMLCFPRYLIGAFLAGVFDGDDSYSERRIPEGVNARVRAIVITTGSHRFALGINELLTRLGIMSTITKDSRTLTGAPNGERTMLPEPSYSITIRNIGDIRKFRVWAKSVKDIPNPDNSHYHGLNKDLMAENKRPYAWVRVTGLVRKKLSNPIKVYNLSIKDTETYLASNFIVHNCGRAGRPKYDKYGESVLIARSQDEADWLLERYVLSQPERVWSKLGVEKVLRPHVLSAIAAGYVRSEEGLFDFFARTFYAHQYGPRMIRGKIGDILQFLAKEEMVEMEGRELSASKFGRRVSELYIDPMSAVILRDALYSRAKKLTEFSFLHMISKTPDLAPRPRPRGGEDEKLALLATQHSDEFMFEAPDQFEDPIAYEDFLSELKAVQVMLDWIDEASEEQILELRKFEPGDLARLVQGTEWLIYASQELARLFGHRDLASPLEVLRVRVGKGVRPELVKLVGLEGVGRVRARMLYNNEFKTVEDIKQRSLTELLSVPTIGPALAKRIKEQAGGLIHADEWEKAKSAKPSDVQEQTVLTEYRESSRE